MSRRNDASDYNDIFGYKVYKPPPEQNLPLIADLNVRGEIVTLIDPTADVIKDPTVQKILQGLDGERTVKIEDLAPDVRYEGWNKKSQYDNKVITDHKGRKQEQPVQPKSKYNMLKPNMSNYKASDDAIIQARNKAVATQNDQKEFSRQLQETRLALEKEIQRQLIEQLMLRNEKGSVTPDQQALIEKLYLDLRLVNPELALATLKASAQAMPAQPQVQQLTQRAAPRQVEPESQSPRHSHSHSGSHSHSHKSHHREKEPRDRDHREKEPRDRDHREKKSSHREKKSSHHKERQ